MTIHIDLHAFRVWPLEVHVALHGSPLKPRLFIFSSGGTEVAIASSTKTAPGKFEMVSRKAATEDYMKVVTTHSYILITLVLDPPFDPTYG